jgi:hypothetical protein
VAVFRFIPPGTKLLSCVDWPPDRCANTETILVSILEAGVHLRRRGCDEKGMAIRRAVRRFGGMAEVSSTLAKKKMTLPIIYVTLLGICERHAMYLTATSGYLQRPTPNYSQFAMRHISPALLAPDSNKNHCHPSSKVPSSRQSLSHAKRSWQTYRCYRER